MCSLEHEPVVIETNDGLYVPTLVEEEPEELTELWEARSRLDFDALDTDRALGGLLQLGTQSLTVAFDVMQNAVVARWARAHDTVGRHVRVPVTGQHVRSRFG
jgi:hypothetical protein